MPLFILFIPVVINLSVLTLGFHAWLQWNVTWATAVSLPSQAASGQKLQYSSTHPYNYGLLLSVDPPRIGLPKKVGRRPINVTFKVNRSGWRCLYNKEQAAWGPHPRNLRPYSPDSKRTWPFVHPSGNFGQLEWVCDLFFQLMALQDGLSFHELDAADYLLWWYDIVIYHAQHLGTLRQTESRRSRNEIFNPTSGVLSFVETVQAIAP